ncbi:uncharacterized protein B0I36DRAFT_234977 [Microdochium trichocladiopsis]|uniref:Flavin-nucleotide-binding protein n=1 Tax=Microdochium trichocladiopsis TaxID=1682393 RepID=A0A9P9BWQ1_9PEZI|nr:uncharacterized protein B0I36DRAFT_234977 [Microdochium trichocladiopsis]KAH7040815.1 hypothetical protein B0I36DRAFT_234977 [Microdochium trichocladiopsis]
MPSVSLEYPTKPFSKVNRYDSRASYSLETIHQIINSCPILHVSFTTPDSPFPMMLPMIGQMGSFDRPSADTGDVLDLYLHGYVSSRIMNLTRQGGDDSGGTKTEGGGMPLTIGASHVDGLVLALTPNSHSYNYRSAVLFGHATLVTELDEKNYAMELITNSVVRDRWRNSRVPPNKAEMGSTSILRVKVAAGSAKIRTGMPSDEKADLADEALLDRVWTGVIPVQLSMGEPLPGPYNRVEKLPAYLEEGRRDFNAWNEEAAVEAANKAMAPKAKSEET